MRDDLRNHVIALNNRAQAQDMARVHLPAAEIRLAPFHNDNAVNATMQMSLLTRLGNTPPRELIEYLKDVVAAESLPRAEA